jgi:hypothetical protein
VDTEGVYPPFGVTAIRREAAVERTGGEAIVIGGVAAYDGAETLDVEERVLEFEGIEGPLD